MLGRKYDFAVSLADVALNGPACGQRLPGASLLRTRYSLLTWLSLARGFTSLLYKHSLRKMLSFRPPKSQHYLSTKILNIMFIQCEQYF